MPSEFSYIPAIADANDAQLVGKHCDLQTCNTLDFLPFRCESCKGTYCLDHRSETAHKCAFEGKWAAERRRREINGSGSGKPSPAASKTATPSPPPQQNFFTSFIGKATSSAASSLPASNSLLEPTTCALATPKQCKTTIHTGRSAGVFCPHCRKYYCLQHRLQESHACNTLKQYPIPKTGSSPISKTTAAAGGRGTSGSAADHPLVTDKAKAVFARIKSSITSSSSSNSNSTSSSIPRGSSSKPTSGKRAPTPALALIQLKKSATGLPSIPLPKRIYVHVSAESKSTTSKIPSGTFFYHSDWSVGKVLDAAASSLGVVNVNNVADEGDEKGEGRKLRVYHVEGGRMLGFSERFGDAVGNGNEVVLLRGVKMSS